MTQPTPPQKPLTAHDVLKKHCFKLEKLTDLLSAFTALGAMEEYAKLYHTSQSKEQGYSLELLMLVFNYGKKYEKTQDLKYSMENAIKDFQSLQSKENTSQSEKETDAVEFANWLWETKDYYNSGNDKWYSEDESDDKAYTTSDLYLVFTSTKKQ